MTLSYNLLVALLLLAPGFGVYAGLYFGIEKKAFRPGAPSPTSILTLAIIVLGAMTAHLAWAALCVLNDILASRGMAVLPPFPNLYTVIFEWSKSSTSRAADGGVAIVLSSILALTVLGGFVAARTVRLKAVRPRYLQLVYGWLAGLVDETENDRIVTAFVATSIEKDGLILGYEGPVLNMNVTADHTVSAITLKKARAFILKIEDGKVSRSEIPRTTAISQIYLDKDQIKNIAFRVFEIED